ncbi:MAG: branched-chain amino acid transport system II carrier protein [Carnobacterium sp.]|jgi:LIVCS family branched-chain amino acid:cation transporter|uniref:branched-chain amino acid transport system II carrier protein n=1 Tax=Carnobacterium TaxID=2747 RepID=UPI00054E35EC|nr:MULTISPECIES: branched-chain amino acid transport system II carrier protein [Carnobacterium]AOA01014.1 branched-chain amino acid transport system II carrier protein [Carnobacterium maltaromaticum]KRN62610.1 branched-chain amino acid transport system II carrier protein [Carnobacterium maltaromaticum DSM 20342]MBQ6485218.1 branched-chain amino acid transport system II carrier protein [Carnobacterium sp.]MCI1820468.1 branched-chain amino acid transport system II carrier protein [Carnobacterium 
MDKRLSLSSYIFIGSMLFGLFFGAGNLIFPVHMGQEAGTNILPATLGFLVTGIGLPFLGVVAIGVSKSDGLFDLASRVHPIYGIFMTVALYMTIGPFFALPRTGTVSYEIGIAPYLPSQYQTIGLLLFTVIFFAIALAFSMKPTKILIWVGKILNPLFLVFLAILIVTAFLKPMGVISEAAVHGNYVTEPFITGFTQGYNTMDALASLAFGIIVVQTIKGLGVRNPSNIAIDTIKSGIVSVILMAVIYGSLAYIGATSVGQFEVSENGGIALAQIAQHYFGSFGSVLLAIIVTVACLKTAIGLITACSETFCEMFPNSFSYRTYVILFTLLACGIANVGLTKIISLSIPVLMFLYPLAITLIFLALLSPLFKNRQVVYVTTTIFTIFVSIADGLNALPAGIKSISFIDNILAFYSRYLPLFDIGMGWVFPAILGLIIGWIISLVKKQELRF